MFRLFRRSLAVVAVLFPAVVAAQPSPTQTLFEGTELPANTGYATTRTVDLQRFIGGSWLIYAEAADTVAAKALVLECHIEIVGPKGHEFAWDTENTPVGRRDGFFLTSRGDSSWLMQTSGSTSVNVTPTANGPAYPWKTSALVYATDDNSGAAHSNLSTPNGPASTGRGWAVAFADAFGNAQWYPGKVRLLIYNRSPSGGAIINLSVWAVGQRAY